MRLTRTSARPVQWIGDIESTSRDAFSKKTFYRAFKFGSLEGRVGDFVLVSNSLKDYTADGCDVAEIVQLYESEQEEDQYRATVKWYSRCRDLPNKVICSQDFDMTVEVVQDNRAFECDVNIETFYSKCQVIGANIDDNVQDVAKNYQRSSDVCLFVCRYVYVCSYRFWKLKPYLSADKNTKLQNSNLRPNQETEICDLEEEEERRSCSPIVPLTEPSMRFCMVEDKRKQLKVVKIPINSVDNKENMKKVEKNKMDAIHDEEKAKNSVYITKLKDKDISRLLDEDESDNNTDVSDSSVKLVLGKEASDSGYSSTLNKGCKKQGSSTMKFSSKSPEVRSVKEHSHLKCKKNPIIVLKPCDEVKINHSSSRASKERSSVKKRLLQDDKTPVQKQNDLHRPTKKETARKQNDLHTPVKSENICTSNKSVKKVKEFSIEQLEPMDKSDVINYYLKSMGASPMRKSAKHKEHWKSIMEGNDGDTSSCNSSIKLKLCRSSSFAKNCDIEEAVTPRRQKRKDTSDAEEESSSKRQKIVKKVDSPRTPKTSRNTMDEEVKSVGVRSSARQRKPNQRYCDEWATPIKSPANSLKGELLNKTPITPAMRALNVTPASKRGSARRLLLTPTVPTRAGSVSTPGSVLEEARSRLHVSAVPKSLPCREKEFENIYRFLEGKILDRAGGCMYISGVPGTGKTATVQEVVRCLKQAAMHKDIPDFQFVELNGMRLTEPRQAYVHLLKSLTGQVMTAEQAQQLLERKFSKSSQRRVTTLLLVDELDLLWTRRQDVVYNLLDWPTKAASHLVVLTIANTMDLPERLLMGRVTSRLGLTRVTFHPYTHKQLQEIVLARLKGLEVFDSDAVQLVARKVAAVSGDARRALDICRRATELAERKNNEIVSMQHVDQALSEMISSTKVQAIRFCSKMEQMFLQAVVAEVQRTGVEETVFEKVYHQLISLCVFDGLQTPTMTEALGVCARLGSCRLLLTEHSRVDIYQRVLLNISTDDIHYALRVQ